MIAVSTDRKPKTKNQVPFNLFNFIYYNFISYKEERGILFSGIGRGLLYGVLLGPASDFLLGMDNSSTGMGLLWMALLFLFAYVFFMQFGFAVIYTLGFHAEYIDPSRIVSRSGGSSGNSGYENIQSALNYGDAIMHSKNTFGKVEYLRENPHMLLKKDSENVRSALKHIDTMVGMKPSGSARAKELKKYLK